MLLPTLHSIELASRFIRMGLADPGRYKNFARRLYRKKIGIPRDRRRSDGFSAPPVRVQLHLTRRCNLRCFMCQQHRNEQGVPAELAYYDPARELPLKQWIDLLDQVAPFHPEIHIIGGEPTLLPFLVELVAEVKKRGLVAHLQTNGTRLSGMADELVRTGLDWISVSIDGPAHVHDRIRGVKGTYDRALNGIKALVEARRSQGRVEPIISVNSVILKDNLDIMHHLVPILADIGVDTLQLSHTVFDTRANVKNHNRVFPSSFAKSENLKLMASKSILAGEYYESDIKAGDIDRVHALLRTVREKNRGRMVLINFPNLSEKLIEQYYLNLDYPFGRTCYKLWESAPILPDGSVQSCFHVANGNITEQPFLDLWNGASFRTLRKIIGKGLLPGCTRCCSRRFTA